MGNRVSPRHIPVLVDEAIAGLQVSLNQKYIDATVGDAGHAEAIIKKGGRLLAIDADPDAIKRAKARLKKVCSLGDRIARPVRYEAVSGPARRRMLSGHPQEPVTFAIGNFKNLIFIARKHGFEEVAGIIFDLGVSANQLESPEKGLSFAVEGPLDMRLDPTLGLTAKEIINEKSEEALYEIFTRNAQEELARPIAKAIVSARRLKPILTTLELARICKEVTGGKTGSKLHPATKVFLALRIEVNAEIENLKVGLNQAIALLKPGGRLAVVSFHETEDRIVKLKFKQSAAQGQGEILTRKPIVPSRKEAESNPRSRSAKLRILKRL